MEFQDQKFTLRRAAQAARSSLPVAVRLAAAQAIRERLRTLPELRTARTVLTYAAGPNELDVGGVAEDLRERGLTTLYPRVHGDHLELVPVTDPTTLVVGHRGIPEPVGPATAITAVDAVIVPGVAFDRTGGRLGQGGGHYDRLLPRIGDALRIGVAFSCQIVPTVPRLAHDATVDIVVTEHSLLRAEQGDRD